MRWHAMLWMAGMIGLLAAAVGAQPAEERMFESILKDEVAADEQRQPAPEDELEEGDRKRFTVKTENDITALRVGDIYKSGGSVFEIDSIEAQGSAGGKFVVKRTRGSLDPDRKYYFMATRDKDRSRTPPRVILAKTSLLDLYIMGGPFLHPIALLGLATLVLAANSVWIYRRARQMPAAFVEQARKYLRRGQLRKFEELALKTRGLFPTVCRAIADRFDVSTAEDIAHRVQIAAAGEINRLRIPVKAMNLIAVAAPLLGLLGTIVGMVIVFEAVAGSTGASKAAALAAGIRVKLFCTALALMVAIPALFLFFIFNSRLSVIIADCEALSEEFLHDALLIKRNGGPKEDEPRRHGEHGEDQDDEQA